MSHNPHAKLVQSYLEHACAAPSDSAPQPWRKWLRRAAGASLVLGGSLAGSGCDHGGGGDPYYARDNDNSGSGGYLGYAIYSAPLPTWEVYCNDGRDDDLDGRMDCADSDCATSSHCTSAGLGGAYGVPLPTQPEICGNGLDDDWDGSYDCADSDCYWTDACRPPGSGVGGAYGIPFAGAGGAAVDPGWGGGAGSPGSSGAGYGGTAGGAGRPTVWEDCVNEEDDDRDGLADCEDPDCIGHAFCPPAGQGGNSGGGGPNEMPPLDAGAAGMGVEDFEVSCSDGVDNDRDGVADCIDPDCKHAAVCGAQTGASGAGGAGSAGAAGTGP